MPLHQLFANAVAHLVKTEAACFLFDLRMEHYLKKNISQLFLQQLIGLAAIVYAISLLLLGGICRQDVLMLPKGEKIAKLLEKHRLLG